MIANYKLIYNMITEVRAKGRRTTDTPSSTNNALVLATTAKILPTIVPMTLDSNDMKYNVLVVSWIKWETGAGKWVEVVVAIAAVC